MIRHAHRAISAYAQDREATVSIRLPVDPLTARISPIEVEQAVVNVLRNAVESRDRGAKIELSLRLDDEGETPRAIIEVTDDGIGIEESDRAQLFAPFFSTRTRQGGTGLGLSVAHGIVTDHGGEIRVDSVPGQGTHVRISLPIPAD